MKDSSLDNAADTTLLLAAAEVPPVFEQNAGGSSPFLLTCDHYGRLIPQALGDLGVSASELKRHIAWDIGIAGVAERLSNHLGAHLIAQRYSRLVIDCNRPPQAPSSTLFWITHSSFSDFSSGTATQTRQTASVRGSH